MIVNFWLLYHLQELESLPGDSHLKSGIANVYMYNVYDIAYNHDCVPVITCRLYFIQIMVHIKIPSQCEAAMPGDKERGGQSDIVTFREKREGLDTLLRWCVYKIYIVLYISSSDHCCPYNTYPLKSQS